MTYEERQNRNLLHLQHPRPGDYWHEMFAPVCVVLSVDGEQITYCESTVDTDENHWTWDLSKTVTIPLEQWRSGMRYQTQPGTIASVEPEEHQLAVQIHHERSAQSRLE